MPNSTPPGPEDGPPTEVSAPAQSMDTDPKEVAAPTRQDRVHRRRERDRRVERFAVRGVFLLSLLVAVSALVYVNLYVDSAPSLPPARPPTPQLSPPVYSAGVDKLPELPALTALPDKGLTIVAEGLPDVRALKAGRGRPAIAALATCRFAYAVWEFSPNHRFRFLSTCAPLKGEVLVGAYEIVGTELRMSPLNTQVDQLVSRFQVERPSSMRTRVLSKGGSPWLEVRQRVNVIRQGMLGDRFHKAYQDKNTVQIPGLVSKREAAPEKAPKKAPQDPLLDLLRLDSGPQERLRLPPPS